MVGAMLGAFIGTQLAGAVIGSLVVLWFLAFLIAAALGSEPSTSVLGWGLTLVLPGAGVAMAGVAVGQGLFKGKSASAKRG
ncbi:MAG: hypothetical protein JWP41_4022 [Ramlibacter sp.]|nr:hypothetical protein [Ramlibacter sp.]